jgi:cell division protein FtsB
VDAARTRNAELHHPKPPHPAEVSDLKTGTDAIDERARYELGMTRPDEVFYQYPDENPAQRRRASK